MVTEAAYNCMASKVRLLQKKVEDLERVTAALLDDKLGLHRFVQHNICELQETCSAQELDAYEMEYFGSGQAGSRQGDSAGHEGASSAVHACRLGNESSVLDLEHALELAVERACELLLEDVVDVLNRHSDFMDDVGEEEVHEKGGVVSCSSYEEDMDDSEFDFLQHSRYVCECWIRFHFAVCEFMKFCADGCVDWVAYAAAHDAMLYEDLDTHNRYGEAAKCAISLLSDLELFAGSHSVCDEDIVEDVFADCAFKEGGGRTVASELANEFVGCADASTHTVHRVIAFFSKRHFCE